MECICLRCVCVSAPHHTTKKLTAPPTDVCFTPLPIHSKHPPFSLVTHKPLILGFPREALSFPTLYFHFPSRAQPPAAEKARKKRSSDPRGTQQKAIHGTGCYLSPSAAPAVSKQASKARTRAPNRPETVPGPSPPPPNFLPWCGVCGLVCQVTPRDRAWPKYWRPTPTRLSLFLCVMQAAKSWAC